MEKIEISDAISRIFQRKDMALICCGHNYFVENAALRKSEDECTFQTYASDSLVYVKDDVTYNGVRYLTRDIYSLSEDNSGCLDFAKKLLLEDSYQFITIYALGKLPPELDSLMGWRKYGRNGERYADNPFDCVIDGVHIRRLSRDDADCIKDLCSSAEDESPYAKNVYDNFSDIDGIFDVNYPLVILGAWDNEVLTGVVSVCSYDMEKLISKNVGQVCDIVVRQDFRRRGIGRALTKAALSVYPDNMYFYNLEKNNVCSIANAKSAGFSFLGADLYVDKRYI